MENSKTTTAFVIGLLVLHVSIDLAVQATEGDCTISQYLDSQGVCKSCNGRTCQPGEKIVTACGKGQDVTCEPCTDLEPGHTCVSGINVRSCISCKSQNKKQVRACDANFDSICEGCLDNHYAEVSGYRVYCLHCQEDKQNRSECRPEPPIIKPSGEGNNDPKLPGEETIPGKDAKRQDVVTPVLITVVSVLIVAVLALLITLWRKSMICKERTYQQTAQRDVESPRPQESEGHDESPAEKDKALCRIEGKRVRFKRQLSSSSTKSEDEERLLGDASTTKRKHRPPKLNLKPSSEVGELDVHCAGPPSVHGVDAAPFPEDGTPSPFPVEEEDVFPHPTDITEATKERPASGVTEIPAPETNMPHTQRESKGFSGQTAKVHSANAAPNNTANKYSTKLASCTSHADTIRLDDEWFNYNIQQKLSVFLDKIQPIPSMPTWRTFFEKFKLKKSELDAVDNRAVPSPSIALFDMLQSRNPGAENCFTVGHVLRQLDRMKFTDAADALCDELLEHMNQSKA